MFVFSSKTQVNKKFKLSELFKLISADKSVKADARCVLSVVLSNVLSSATTNLPSKDGVREIYIFDIELSESTIPQLFISSLDKVVRFHTVFVLHCGEKEMLCGAYKQMTDSNVKVGKYHLTKWRDASTPTSIPLDVSSLDDVYKAIMQELVSMPARMDESARAFVTRCEQVAKLKKDIDNLQRQVDIEKQSKIRFELNDELKKLKKEMWLLNDKT